MRPESLNLDASKQGTSCQFPGSTSEVHSGQNSNPFHFLTSYPRKSPQPRHPKSLMKPSRSQLKIHGSDTSKVKTIHEYVEFDQS